MHNSLAVALIHGLCDLLEDGKLILLGELVVVFVEVVHEGHLHEVCNETNVVILEVEIAQLNDVNVLN